MAVDKGKNDPLLEFICRELIIIWCINNTELCDTTPKKVCDCVIIIHYFTVYYPASQVYFNYIQMNLKST